MRRSLSLALLGAALVAGCGKSDCQLLEERICQCTGQTSDQCTTQAQSLLGDLNPGQSVQDECRALLHSCNAPDGVPFCEYIHTPTAKVDCGFAPQSVSTTTPP
jgi:hypothetical protein